MFKGIEIHNSEVFGLMGFLFRLTCAKAKEAHLSDYGV
jgi:hypothetical protein